ncbi:phage holin family protein [Gynuella sunshinyii]|uniref:phage holin family protein n=1 Tax=Gynuella sunshinyii TaxID=1445505 RepID=UPI000699C0B1|nr:phage holin family protein [Gynuella sunshinyii]
MKTESEALSINILNILRLFRSSSQAILAQANLHQRLIKLEWEEEKKRLSRLFIIYLFGFACLICLIFFLGFLVVALSWDTQYRTESILILCCMYGLGVYFSWKIFSRLVKAPEGFFSNTREELAADFSMIKSKL